MKNQFLLKFYHKKQTWIPDFPTRDRFCSFLWISPYDLVVIYVCHFHHHFRQLLLSKSCTSHFEELRKCQTMRLMKVTNHAKCRQHLSCNTKCYEMSWIVIKCVYMILKKSEKTEKDWKNRKRVKKRKNSGETEKQWRNGKKWWETEKRQWYFS